MPIPITQVLKARLLVDRNSYVVDSVGSLSASSFRWSCSYKAGRGYSCPKPLVFV